MMKFRYELGLSQNTADAETAVPIAAAFGKDIARIEVQETSVLRTTDRTRPVVAAAACAAKGAAANTAAPRQIERSLHKVSSISSKVIIIKNI